MSSKNINTFMLKVSIFILLIFVIFIIGLIIPDKSTVQNLNYSIIDKQRLLQEVGSPRLILVGGSNLSFGIDSKKIQDSLNINVIDTGIQIGYGLEFMLDYVSPYIKDGDTVILILEYELFFGKGALGNALTLLQAIDAVPNIFSLLSSKQVLSLFKAIPKYSIWKIMIYLLSPVKPNVASKEIGLYERRSFNSFGDVDVHWSKSSEIIKSTALEGNFNPVALKILKDFRKIIEMKNGRLYMSYPSLNYSSYKLSEIKIRIVEQELIKNNFVILGNPERYSFSDNLYFNLCYHLNKKGVDIRTELLIQDLKKHGL